MIVQPANLFRLGRHWFFSTSVIWTSTSILDGNDNEASCEGKDIDFSTSVIWISLSILDNNDNEVSCESTNSVEYEKGGKPFRAT